MNNDILIEVKKVSKKFSKKLNTSLRYGVQDLAASFVGIKTNKSKLRKDEFWAVKGVSFQLERGSCLGLIGHNGAGKSTLLKMLNGLIKPDEGEIIMRGRIGSLIELGAGFNPILTGRENVYINGQILGFTKNEIDEKYDEIVDFSEIGDFIDTPVQNYSSGMKVRLGFAVAAQMEPDVLLIDEVLAVGDIGFKAKCFDRINEIQKTCAVIFVSHSMTQISRLCSELIHVDNGEVEYYGKNISIGIEQFFSKFSNEKFRIIGNSTAFALGEVKLNSNLINYEEETRIKQFEQIYIEFDIKALIPIDNIGIQISVFDRELKGVAIVSTQNGNILYSLLNGQESIKVSLPANFAPGKYNFNILIIEHKSNGGFETICAFMHVIKVIVKGGTLHTMIPVHFDAKWESGSLK